MTCDTTEGAIDAKTKSSEGSTKGGNLRSLCQGSNFCFLVQENTAVGTVLISKVFITQMTMTTLGYFKKHVFQDFAWFAEPRKIDVCSSVVSEDSVKNKIFTWLKSNKRFTW